MMWFVVLSLHSVAIATANMKSLQCYLNDYLQEEKLQPLVAEFQTEQKNRTQISLFFSPKDTDVTSGQQKLETSAKNGQFGEV